MFYGLRARVSSPVHKLLKKLLIDYDNMKSVFVCEERHLLQML